MKFRSTLIVTASVLISGANNFQPVLAESNAPILQQAKKANKDRQYDRAIELSNKALQQNPTLADAYLERGKARYYLYENKSAIADFDLAIKYKPNSADTYLERGKAKNSLDEYKAAIADFDLALQQKSNFAAAYLARGKSKYYLKTHNAAIADFDRALKYKPNLIDAYIERGRSKGELKQYTAAIEDFDRAIAIDPKSMDAYALRGAFYRIYLKQKERGDRDFNFVLKIEPKTSDNYNALALIFELKNQYQAGIDFFTKELAANNRNNQSAHWWRADFYRLAGKYELAITGYQTYLKLNPESKTALRSNTYQNISASYLNLNKYTEAIDYANKALKLDPKNDLALANRGSAFYWQNNYSAALADFNAAIEISPKTGRYYDWRGFIYYYDFKNDRQAIIEYDRAIALGFSSPQIYRNRGYAKERLDLTTAALADYQQGLELARQDGNLEIETSLKNSIEDIHTQTQRMVMGIAIASILTGIGYSGLVALARRNETKYLQNFANLDRSEIESYRACDN